MSGEPARSVGDPGFQRETHERWLTQRNRFQETDGYRDEWWSQQCFACRFWIPLSGPIGRDYGACTNPESPFDGHVRFEHDGCAAFLPVDDT